MDKLLSCPFCESAATAEIANLTSLFKQSTFNVKVGCSFGHRIELTARSKEEAEGYLKGLVDIWNTRAPSKADKVLEKVKSYLLVSSFYEAGKLLDLIKEMRGRMNIDTKIPGALKDVKVTATDNTVMSEKQKEKNKAAIELLEKWKSEPDNGESFSQLQNVLEDPYGIKAFIQAVREMRDLTDICLKYKGRSIELIEAENKVDEMLKELE